MQLGLIKGYAAGLAIGAVVVAGWKGVQHVRSKPVHIEAAEPTVAPIEAPAPVVPPAPYEAEYGTLPDFVPGECRDYLTNLVTLDQCVAIAESTRESMKSSGHTLADTWRDPSFRITGAAIMEMAQSCTDASKAIDEAITVACPPTPEAQ